MKRPFRGMSRLLVVAFAGSLLAWGLILNPVTAQTVGACGWYVESYGAVNGQWVWDSWANAWNYLQFEIVTYNDGCGSRFYKLYEWTSTGTSAHLHLDIRLWVCGQYEGIWTGDLWANSGYLQSLSFFYYGCGRQADDSSSWIQNTYAYSPTTGSAYVTA